jgi:hypothetical protein
MPGGGGEITIGYKYYLGMHMVLCHGPIDHLCNIKVDGRLAWAGTSEGGREEFDGQLAGALFGGDKREGGIGGEFDVEMGGAAQEPNLYLVEQLGADVPAFRGVAAVVLNQCYVGNNPYLKAWSFCAQRIHKRKGGETQWYDAKAAIGKNPLEEEAFRILTNWADEDFPNGGTGEWYRTPVVGASPPAGGTFGTFWKGTSQGGTLTAIVNPSIPIGNISNYTGTVNIPPLPFTAYIRVRIYHDDFMSGSLGISGTALASGQAGNYPLAKDSYYYSYQDIRVAANSDITTISFSYNVIQGVPSGTTTGFGGGYLLRVLPPAEYYADNGPADAEGACFDMNPAHIIRECLTDPDWGMGYLDGDIDDTAFMAAADTLYEESLGMSLLWDRQIPLEDFIAEILRHIDAVLYVDRVSGKFVLNLIRDDYSLSNLPVFNEYNISDVSNARRPTLGELTNSITVTYYDKDNESGVGSASIQDQALIQIQGATIATNIQYTGFTNYNNAARVAQRDLKALSIPLLSADIVVNRQGSYLNVGDPFIFSWPDHNINSVVMRVQSISVGDGRDNSVKITALEDVFSLSTPSSIGPVEPDSGLWVDPTTVEPLAAYPRIVTETPYWSVVQRLGQLSTDTILADDSDAGFLWTAGGRQGGELNANLLVDSGAGYVDSAIMDFAPYGFLSADAWYTDVTFYYSGGVDIEDVPVGTIAQIGEELVRVDGFGSDSSGNYVTVGRGVLDTVPGLHVVDSNGTDIVFIGNYQSGNEVQYTASDVVDIKMQTLLGANILAEADAPIDTVTFDSRAIRPYPPGDLKINTTRYPLVILGAAAFTWVHRDRLQQTSGILYDAFDTGIGPEASTNYTLRIYGETDTLIHTESGLTGTSFTYTTGEELIDSGIPAPTDLYSYTWSTNGSFTLSGDSDLIMIAVGGGGGGASFGGGGGGGGGVAILSRTLSAGTYTVTVGTGAAARASTGNGNVGTSSTIDAFIEGTTGLGGISGGTGQAGGASGQGLIDGVVANASFAGSPKGTNVSGGGGGAGEAGGVGNARNGGDGLLAAVLGDYFGGGGGGSSSAIGGPGGLGGGAAGAPAPTIKGTDGLGGGGGGAWNSGAHAGTAGGRGTIIVISADPAMTTSGTVAVEETGGLRLNSNLRVELESVIGSYTSMQKYNYSFDRAGYGYHYGNYYGGI